MVIGMRDKVTPEPVIRGRLSMTRMASMMFAAVIVASPVEVLAEFSIADCEKQIVENKGLQMLKGKLDLLNAANQPIEILANNKKPTAKEKAAIALWVEEQKRCSTPGIEYQKSQSPEVGAIFDKAYADLFISAADLYQGQITYGDFAKASVRRHQEVRERIALVVARFREQQALKVQQEEFARQQEVDRQRYEHQQRCEALSQDISRAANAGPSSYEIQQQRQAQLDAAANAYAAQDPFQRATAGAYRAGGQIAEIGAGMFGMQRPEMAAAQQRQAALMQMVETYKKHCQN